MKAADELLVELRRLLSTSKVSYHAASDPWDVYEGYLFSLVVATASRHGATVTYRDIDNNLVSDLVFRTSPGDIYSRAARYTYALVEFAGAPALEVHVGVKVMGKSGVLHECDVLVLPAEEAATSRALRYAPRGSQCVLVIECKYYTSGLRLAQARNFEGLRVDVSTLAELFVSNIGTTASSVVKYFGSRRKFEPGVVPADTARVGYVQAQIRGAFKDYFSKHAPSVMI
ncbi:hypothetical protein [Streptomyces sp. NPDC046860]|uniref:hypothetical protein n=1 Tax=Streptomyces sp. NPDC046860 TaxID=3154495 RepID=UPI0033E953E0